MKVWLDCYGPKYYNPCMNREFIELPAFTRRIQQGWLSDEELRSLQLAILRRRGRIDRVPEFSGLLKIRNPNPRRQRGVRGGYRVYFVDYPDWGVIVLILITDKELQSDLSESQRKSLRESLAGLRKDVEQYVKGFQPRRRI